MSPKVRQSIYILGTIGGGLISLLVLWGIADAPTAASLNSIIAGVGGLFGTGASATAAVVVGKQRNDGTLHNMSPDQVIATNVQAVIDKAAAASADVDKVRQAVAAAVDSIPGIGPLTDFTAPLTQQVIRSRWGVGV